MGFTRRQLLTGQPARAASRLSPPRSPWRARLGDSCLALRGVQCQICGDCCPEHAITFRRQPGGLARPTVQPTRCTGCGHCLPVCPVAALNPDPT